MKVGDPVIIDDDAGRIIDLFTTSETDPTCRVRMCRVRMIGTPPIIPGQQLGRVYASQIQEGWEIETLEDEVRLITEAEFVTAEVLES